jgi:hypothetical protein
MGAITLALGLLAAALTADASGPIPGASVEFSTQTLWSRFFDTPVESLTHFSAVRHHEATNQRFKSHEEVL